MTLSEARAFITVMNVTRASKAALLTAMQKMLQAYDLFLANSATHEAVARTIVDREDGANVIEVQFARAK